MLTEDIKLQLRQAAIAEGANPDEVIAEAEALAVDQLPEDGKPAEGGKPIAERLLVGFLFALRVNELREHWLGMEPNLPDGELSCLQYQFKHGGGKAPSAEPDPE